MSEFSNAKRRLAAAIAMVTRTDPKKPTDDDLMTAMVDWLGRNPHLAEIKQDDHIYVTERGLACFVALRKESPDLVTRWFNDGLLDRSPSSANREPAKKILKPN